MSKFTKPAGEVRYMNGLWNADSKGFAAGQDAQFTERDNPYKQFEHRQFWLDGFRRARIAEASPQSRTVGLPEAGVPAGYEEIKGPRFISTKIISCEEAGHD